MQNKDKERSGGRDMESHLSVMREKTEAGGQDKIPTSLDQQMDCSSIV